MVDRLKETEPGNVALYEYDFSESWEQEPLHEGNLLKEKAEILWDYCLKSDSCTVPKGF
jgi:hypothetical protein